MIILNYSLTPTISTLSYTGNRANFTSEACAMSVLGQGEMSKAFASCISTFTCIGTTFELLGQALNMYFLDSQLRIYPTERSGVSCLIAS